MEKHFIIFGLNDAHNNYNLITFADHRKHSFIQKYDT